LAPTIATLLSSTRALLTMSLTTGQFPDVVSVPHRAELINGQIVSVK
jgi:hypothetical protein